MINIKEIDRITDDIKEIYPDFIITGLGITSNDGSDGFTLFSLDSKLAKKDNVSVFSTMLTLIISNAEKQIEGFNFNEFILKHKEAMEVINKERKS